MGVTAEEAKSQVNECEKEIAGIKARLKTLGPAATSEEAETKNVLTVKLIKVRTRMQIRYVMPCDIIQFISCGMIFIGECFSLF